MSNPKGQSSLVNKLILVVLVLILGCLGALLYKVCQPPPSPVESVATAEIVVPLPEPVTNTVTVQTPPVVRSATRPAADTRTSVASPTPPLSPPPPTPPEVVEPAPAPAAPRPVPAPTEPILQPGGIAYSGPRVRYEAQPTGSEMRIEGKATGKTWHCIGKIIAGFFEVEAAWQSDLSLKSVTSLGPGKTPPNCFIRIPVRSLKSQAIAGASTMDKRMQAEMKADRFPYIDFRLTELTLISHAPLVFDSRQVAVFKAEGDLAVAGVTNRVSFEVKMGRPDPRQLFFDGDLKLKMTDFGIKPPEFALLGVGLKTEDEIELSWTWRVALPP
ncbi:MAG: YceI family protein [Verrucomicrobia bacterium]|nr:YceI family protein [Verrucomicrobiota bacterium]